MLVLQDMVNSGGYGYLRDTVIPNHPVGFGGSGELVQVGVLRAPQVGVGKLQPDGSLHEGGYLPFSADITAALLPGENRLEVKAVDTLSRDYPYGKQHKRPHGMWYTPGPSCGATYGSPFLRGRRNRLPRRLPFFPDYTTGRARAQERAAIRSPPSWSR